MVERVLNESEWAWARLHLLTYFFLSFSNVLLYSAAGFIHSDFIHIFPGSAFIQGHRALSFRVLFFSPRAETAIICNKRPADCRSDFVLDSMSDER